MCSVKFTSAEEEYKKNKDLKEEDIIALQKWAEKQYHLPKLSQKQLILFLQSCYYSQEAAKQAIENYFTIRTHSPEIFQNVKMQELKHCMDLFLVAPLPKRTPEGYHVLYTRLIDSNPEKYIFNRSVKLFDMVTTLALAQHGTSTGHILVVDAAGATFGHVLKVNLLISKKFIFYLQEALPVRVKAVHVINAMSIVDKLLQMVKQFIHQNILDIIHIHSSMDTFFKHIPQEIMPEEFGGKAGCFKTLQDEMIANLFNNENFFEEQAKELVDESKRIEKSNTFKKLGELSMEGSFKKLDID